MIKNHLLILLCILFGITSVGFSSDVADKALEKELKNYMSIAGDIEANLKTLQVLYPIENLYTFTIQEDDIVNTFNIRKDQLYVLDIGIKGNIVLKPVQQSDMYKTQSSLFFKVPKDGYDLLVYTGGKKYTIKYNKTYSFDTVYLVSGRNSISKMLVTYNGIKELKNTLKKDKAE
jgi:hypothetical protein